MPPTADSPPPYAYRCVDKSILVGPFRRYWVPLFNWWVPHWLPANIVTLGSSLCMWALLWLAVENTSFSPGSLALAFAVLIQAYVIYDHVDGMQAKKTGTSSALGEFLDHYLDVYHAAISTLAIFALVGFDHRLLVLAMLWCGHLAFAATMVEEKERRELFFGAIGSLEGVLLFTGFFISWMVPDVRAWWLAPLVAGFPAYWLLVVGGGLGALIATADCLRRIGRLPRPFAAFAIGSLALAYWLAKGPLPFWTSVSALILYCGDYTGRVLGSHLLHRPHPSADWVALIFIPIGSVLPTHESWLGPVLLIYLGGRTLVGVAGILHPLRGYWRWVNPTPVAPTATPAPT